MNAKKIMIIAFLVVVLAGVINFLTGTTIIINGKQVTGVGGYLAAYLALVFFAAAAVIIIPSTFILITVLVIALGIFFIVFFPLLPIASLLFPGIVLLGIIYLVYKLVKKRRRK